MKFRITCHDSNNNIEYWTYDSIDNVFVDPKNINRFEQYKDPNKPNTFYCGVNLGCMLIINLGDKCNFHCKYCQEKTKDKECGSIIEAHPSKVSSLISKLRNTQLQPRLIKLWGGEPLVYWKTIEKLVPQLRSLYPNIPITIITNGSLLDSTKTKFIIDHKIKITLSYDGKNTLRDYDIFEDNKVCESIKHIFKSNKKLIRILPLSTQINETSDVIKHNLESQLGIQELYVNMHNTIKCMEDEPSFIEYMHIDDDKLEQIYQVMFNTLLHNEDDESSGGLTFKLNNFILDVVRGYGINHSGEYCSHCVGDVISINMDGQILLCENKPDVILGTLDNIDSIEQQRLKYFHHYTTKRQCLMCPYINICHGLCPLVKSDSSIGFKEGCRNYKTTLGKAYFNAAFFRLFGLYVDDVSIL